VGVRIDQVAVGAGAVGPLPAGGLAFHPGEEVAVRRTPLPLRGLHGPLNPTSDTDTTAAIDSGA
jgi:hypothetical protein